MQLKTVADPFPHSLQLKTVANPFPHSNLAEGNVASAWYGAYNNQALGKFHAALDTSWYLAAGLYYGDQAVAENLYYIINGFPQLGASIAYWNAALSNYYLHLYAAESATDEASRNTSIQNATDSFNSIFAKAEAYRYDSLGGTR